MAIGEINPEELNEAVGGVTEGINKLEDGLTTAGIGTLSFTEKASSLMGVLSELGTTLDYLARNPFLSFAFFDRIGRHIQKDIINNLKLTKLATDEQIKSWNTWGSVINFTGSAILSFASKVSSLQSQLRLSSIEATRYFNTLSMPYGTSFNTMLELKRRQAIQTMDYNSEFGRAYVEVTQTLGRLINPANIQSMTGLPVFINTPAYENYLTRLTLYSRKFPEANIPETTKRLYEMFGGYGLTPFGAAGAAMQFARLSGQGRYVPTAGQNETINALLGLMQNYINKGMSRATAFQAAQTTLLGLGQLKGPAGETMSLSNVMNFADLYMGRAGEREIVARALGLGTRDRQRMLGPEGVLYYLQELQRWSRNQGLQNLPKSEVRDIVTQAFAGRFGADWYKLIQLAQAPTITTNLGEASKFLQTLSDLNTQEIDQLRKSLKGLADPYALGLAKQESMGQTIPSLVGGAIDWLSTTGTEIATELHMNPLDLQLLIASGFGIVGVIKLRNMFRKFKTTTIPKLFETFRGGTSIGGEFISPGSKFMKFLESEGGGAVEGVGKSLLSRVGSKVLPKLGGAAGIAGIAAVLSLASGKRGKDVTEDVASSLLYQIGGWSTPAAALKFFFTPTDLGEAGPTTNEMLNYRLRSTLDLISSGKSTEELAKQGVTQEYLLDLQSQLEKQLRKEGKKIPWEAEKSEKKEGTLNVVFSLQDGTKIGEAVAEVGKETFVNINIGSILNSISTG